MIICSCFYIIFKNKIYAAVIEKYFKKLKIVIDGQVDIFVEVFMLSPKLNFKMCLLFKNSKYKHSVIICKYIMA